MKKDKLSVSWRNVRIGKGDLCGACGSTDAETFAQGNRFLVPLFRQEKMYQYTESGLRNVWLRNGYTLTDTPYGPAVAVQNLHGLIRAIVSALVQKTSTLTSPEIRYLRHYLDVSQKDFAKFVGVQEQTVSLWERSKQRIPKSADIVLRALAAETLSGGKLQFRELLDAISRKDEHKIDQFTFQAIKHQQWLMAA